MTFEANIPIYLQIMDDFKKLIISGKYQPADKVPSVRDLALEYGVNPNTVQRALSELERLHLVKSERTAGRFITEDKEIIEDLKLQFIKNKVDGFIRDLKELNFTDKDIIQHVERSIKHGDID